MFPVLSHPSDLESLRTKTALESPWKGLYQVLFTTQMAAKLQGLEPWVHISQLKRVPSDSRNCTPAGDLKIKLTRKRRSQHRGRLPPPKTLDQECFFHSFFSL